MGIFYIEKSFFKKNVQNVLELCNDPKHNIYIKF